MKFFHLSDLHIGLKLYGHDLTEDQTAVFDSVISYAREEQPDAVVIAGDIYDKAVPSAEAVELFDAFITRLAGAVPGAHLMIISGNHDSAARVNLFRGVLSKQRIHLIGQPPVREGERIEKVILQDAYGPVNFYLLPFVKPSMVRAAVGREEDEGALSYEESLRRLLAAEQIDERERNVLVSHQFYVPAGSDPACVDRTDAEVRTIGNIDAVSAGLLSGFDYAALGHIHKPMQVGSERIRYCGTPLACSVSEAMQEKAVLEVELAEKGTAHITALPLKPLRQVRIVTGPLHDVLTQGCSDYVSVVLTDRTDLDVIDMQDRFRHAFPNLLEIRRETLRTASYQNRLTMEKMPEPYELCTMFLQDLDEEEEALLKDVINTVQEAET